MARAAARNAHRALPGLVAALALALTGCGGGDGGSQSDVDAIAGVLESAADAVADREGDRACGYLTEDAQRQAVLQFGGPNQLNTDCGTFVNRTTLFLTPLDRERIGDLEATEIAVDGTKASAALRSQTGTQQPMSARFNLEKVEDDWKISGFLDVQGVSGS